MVFRLKYNLILCKFRVVIHLYKLSGGETFIGKELVDNLPKHSPCFSVITEFLCNVKIK